MNEKGGFGMNTEDYVSFECAKLLKEKGYNYIISGTCIPERMTIVSDKNIRIPCAPLISLWHAAKWLRYVKAIFINLGNDTTFSWWYEVETLGVGRELDNGSGFDSYESALSAGIEAALKLI